MDWVTVISLVLMAACAALVTYAVASIFWAACKHLLVRMTTISTRTTEASIRTTEARCHLLESPVAL
jgi:hypothetical protein